MEENKKSKRGMRIVFVVFILLITLIIGYTYSFFQVTVTNGDKIAADVSCYTVNYTKGQDIAGELVMGTTYDTGHSTDIVLYSNSSCGKLTGRLYITTNNTTTMDLTDEALRYTVVVNNSVVSEGFVNGEENQVIYENFLLNTSSTTYKVYIWLDSTKEDMTTTGTESYSGFIHADVYVGGDNPITPITLVSATSVVPNCNGSTAVYNYSTKKFEISNVSISSSINCSPIYSTTQRITLASHIKDGLVGTTQGDGQVVNENGYRYEGKNPNNYVWFNNELWRIIGVFDETSHGQEGEYLTKIIREDTIGGLAWDKNDSGNWATSSLYNLLNSAYYDAEDGSDSESCYQYMTRLPGTCDYRVKGIQDEYREMVKNVTWYLGGYSDSNITTDNFYTYERSKDDTYYYSGNDKTTTGYVGLMYVSDYGYSVLSSSCDRITNLDSYYTEVCAGSSWLKKETYEWTVTHRLGSAFVLYSTGQVKSYTGVDYASDVKIVRPVLYLNSSIYIINGNGSLTNPFIIGMS